MRLVVDTSVLLAESLRSRGQMILEHPSLELVMATEVWDETQHEFPRRVGVLIDRGWVNIQNGPGLLEDALTTIATYVTLVQSDTYADHREEALRRIPRDAKDAPTLALALTLECGIWTADRDFFGCGVPVWTTETLLRHLESQNDT